MYLKLLVIDLHFLTHNPPPPPPPNHHHSSHRSLLFGEPMLLGLTKVPLLSGTLSHKGDGGWGAASVTPTPQTADTAQSGGPEDESAVSHKQTDE